MPLVMIHRDILAIVLSTHQRSFSLTSKFDFSRFLPINLRQSALQLCVDLAGFS